MSFRVTIDAEGSHYPVIAETAVQWGADGAYIWAVDDGVARRLSARIMQRQQGRVLVDADVDAGRLIVVEGIQRLRDGTPIEYEVGTSTADAGNGATIPAKPE